MRIGLLAALVSAAITAPAAAQTAPGTLTVERVAALPALTGTAPASPTWSPDSRRLAFRWNDQGWPFRDIWITDAEGT